jgi:tetratricopeptide (TPR) repeat protein
VESQIARTRAIASRATPRSDALSMTVESWDPRLSSALALLAIYPTAEQHRQVAAEYRRLRILDIAHQHLTKAVQLDPTDAAAHDELARIWRDWGFPNLGLRDSQRAVQLSPDSPVAANTLGTLYAAAGRLADAHEWYRRALVIDPGASYALNNYCYTAVRLGRSYSVSACEKAAAAQPDATPVRNNLGLAYAASGNLDRAREEFARVGDAEAHYNLGLVHLAQGRYRRAMDAFTAALVARPVFPLAAARVRQTRALMASQGTP